MAIRNVIFDFGGVLIDWDPRYVYRSLFKDDGKMEYFLAHICTSEWNAQMDKGLSFDECIAELSAQYPDYAEFIGYWKTKWPQMLGGQIDCGVALLDAVQKSGRYTAYGLTNWSAETFPIAFESFKFLQNLEGIVVSGEEKTIKPEKGIYLTLLERYKLNPEECLFIDDNEANLVTARSRGIQTVLFSPRESAAQEAARLLELSL
ncbi:MAG: HAD family phosphatase [Succinivibrio sp.]|nr:HAD family phosphatase [Succinivibrio sp.]